MNRRQFASFAVAGLGLVASRAGHATTGFFTGGPILPPPAMPKARTAFDNDALFQRARAALELHAPNIALRDRIALADFSRASRDVRFHIVDLISGQTNSYLVAHGRGSDPDHSGWLEYFSNIPDSKASSSGAYLTGAIYAGQHGQSMRLRGLDGANSNAEMRAIVIHGADYVSEEHIAAWGKLGRSEGCFAVAQHMVPQVMALLGPGRMLYADKVA